MDEVRLVGRNEQASRDLYLSVAPDLKSWSPDLTVLPGAFVALLALDADAEDDETLEALASRLMAAGCHYVCAWGPGCKRVHDTVDLIWNRENPDPPTLPKRSSVYPSYAWDEAFVMTTAHDREPLDEALWFAVFNTYVDEHELSSVLALVSPPYAEHVERRFADSELLDRDVVGE